MIKVLKEIAKQLKIKNMLELAYRESQSSNMDGYSMGQEDLMVQITKIFGTTN